MAAGALILDPVEGTPCLFLPWVHQAERAIAAGLRRLAGGRPPWQIDDADARVEAVERTLALRLAEGQRTALRMALTTKLGMITGGPGTGKTTLVEAILAGLAAAGVEVQLAAPTGRAAKRLSREHRDAMPRPSTACSRPSPGGGFRRGAERPWTCDLLVIDEMSMVDVPLMQAVLAAVPDAAALLLVGDVDQLPSIGPGQVLADLIASAPPAGGPARADLPPGGREPDRAQRPPGQPRPAARARARGGRALRLLCDQGA